MCSSIEAFLCFGCMFWITSVKICFLERWHLTHENNISLRKQNHPVILELLKDFRFAGSFLSSFLSSYRLLSIKTGIFWTMLNKRRVLSCFFLQWSLHGWRTGLVTCPSLIIKVFILMVKLNVLNVFCVSISCILISIELSSAWSFVCLGHGTPKYMLPEKSGKSATMQFLLITKLSLQNVRNSFKPQKVRIILKHLTTIC